MPDKNELKETYLNYVNSFCQKYEGRTVKPRADGASYIYDSVQSILVSRLKGENFEEIYSLLGQARLNNKNFDCTSPKIKLENTPYLFNCYRAANHRYGVVMFSDEEELIDGNLTYDGICAYLAFAKEDILLKNSQIIVSEIERNAKNEMLEVDASQDNGVEQINAIGNKYVELECVAGKMFEIARQKPYEEEEVKKDQDDNIANSALAYTNVLKSLEDFSRIIDENNLLE